MRSVHAHVANIAAFVLLLCARAAAAPPPALSYDAIFADDVNGRSPSQLAWSPDGRTLTWVDEDGLWSLDPVAGTPQNILRRAGLEAEIAAYQWSPRGDSLLLESGADLYLLGLPGHGLRRLTETAAVEQDPKFSPDGTRIAFVRGFNLYLMDLSSGREQALTQDGKENEIVNGAPDWLYWEEIWHRNPTGYWWSPDGKSIAYYRFDEHDVPAHPIVDEGVRIPRVGWQKYPKPGDTNPKVRVGVLDLAGGRTTWMETGDLSQYLARVAWTPDGGALAIQAMNRSQSRLDLLRCAVADGHCGTLVTESSPTWVNVVDDARFLPDGRFLWASERSGWRQLEAPWSGRQADPPGLAGRLGGVVAGSGARGGRERSLDPVHRLSERRRLSARPAQRNRPPGRPRPTSRRSGRGAHAGAGQPLGAGGTSHRPLGSLLEHGGCAGACRGAPGLCGGNEKDGSAPLHGAGQIRSGGAAAL